MIFSFSGISLYTKGCAFFNSFKVGNLSFGVGVVLALSLFLNLVIFFVGISLIAFALKVVYVGAFSFLHSFMISPAVLGLELDLLFLVVVWVGYDFNFLMPLLKFPPTELKETDLPLDLWINLPPLILYFAISSF